MLLAVRLADSVSDSAVGAVAFSAPLDAASGERSADAPPTGSVAEVCTTGLAACSGDVPEPAHGEWAGSGDPSGPANEVQPGARPNRAAPNPHQRTRANELLDVVMAFIPFDGCCDFI